MRRGPRWITRLGALAASTIPIVMAAASDPVATGLVSSLARPGGNITGRTWLDSEGVAKQLGILKETAPRITRVVYLRGRDPWTYVQGAWAGARALGVTLLEVEMRQTVDAARVLDEIRRTAARALWDSRSGERGRPDGVRPQRPGGLPADCLLRRPNPEGRQAGRSPGRAAAAVRPPHQHEDGAEDGKRYASRYPVLGGIEQGTGVVQDGNIITSGTCPYRATASQPDGTAELTQKFIEALTSNH